MGNPSNPKHFEGFAGSLYLLLSIIGVDSNLLDVLQLYRFVLDRQRAVFNHCRILTKEIRPILLH
jgi:hypothetical protein